jgi:ArsR family transcriptional regulator
MPTAKPTATVPLDPEWFELEAEMMRVMANPKRLMILETLKGGKRTVTEISSALGMSLQNASQHLRVMRAQRIVKAERSGQTVRYELTSPVLGRCCALVRSLLVEQAVERGESVASAGTAAPRRRARAAATTSTAPKPPAEGVIV